jgi:hypothetical protein
LYDPLEDDENEGWIERWQGARGNKPLVCPGCFRQVAFGYKEIKKGMYEVGKPIEIVVVESKVIRNKDCREKMDIDMKNLESTDDNNKLDRTAQMLLEREKEFNVKIVCRCLCGIDIGYYDVNK